MNRENGSRKEDENEEIGLGKNFGLLYGMCSIVGTMIGTFVLVQMYCNICVCLLI